MPRTALLLLLALAAAPAAGADGAAATVSIIIDDLGHSPADRAQMAQLPAAVACAVLPHTAHAREVAQAAHQSGREVLLHQPMEPRETAEPGPGRLDAHMPAAEMRATLDYNLSTVPFAVGINNHMGSLLTTQPAAMDWLMDALQQRRLFFIDSRTHAASIAADSARRHGLPVLVRDVFLDDDPSPAAIDAQLQRLERLAHRKGHALAIGHPYPATLAALRRWLPQLAERGIRLVPLTTRLAQIRQSSPAIQPAATAGHPRKPEVPPWHASWFH